MKKCCVIDCSFFISSFLTDEQSVDYNLLDFCIYVPGVFFLECENVLLSAMKRKRITETQHEECLSAFRDLPIIVDHFSTSAACLHQIYQLATKHNLTSYDSSYLELALRLRAPIGTLDKKLKDACTQEKLSVLC